MLTSEDEQKIKQIIQDYFSTFIVSDRYVFQKHLQLFDGKNIQLAKSTGTIIGTEITQKLGFFDTTPVIKQNHIDDATGAGGTYNQTQVQSIVSAVNAAVLVLEKFGFIKNA